MSYQQPIWLYVVALQNDFLNSRRKKPITTFSHWAVCIEGICYEIRSGNKNAGEKKFVYARIAEQKWKVDRKFMGEPRFLGHTAKPYSSDLIHEIAELVWDKTLKKKYIYDENNCQSFVRLLIELVGDATAREQLPRFFDEFVKHAAIGRDGTIFALAGGMALIGVGLVTAGVDMGSTAAAGFGIAGATVFSSTAALFNIRDAKSKYIEKSQKDIRDYVRRKYDFELA